MSTKDASTSTPKTKNSATWNAFVPIALSVVYYIVHVFATNEVVDSIFRRNILPLFTQFIAKDKIPFFFVFVSFLYIFVSKLPVNFAQSYEGKGYDNSKPRLQQGRLTGWGARAVGAHQNSFEAFSPFAAAVIIATFSKVPVVLVIKLGFVFVTSRLVYHILYLINWSLPRTLIFYFGLMATAKVFVLAIFI